MLVLDRSGSMLGNKIEQLKAGAHFWVDYVRIGEELGIVRFSGTPTLASGMLEVPAAAGAQATWRGDRHVIIDGINAGSQRGLAMHSAWDLPKFWLRVRQRRR